MKSNVDNLFCKQHFCVDDARLNGLKFLQEPNTRDAVDGGYRERYTGDIRRVKRKQLRANSRLVEVGETLAVALAHRRAVALVELVVFTEIIVVEDFIDRLTSDATKNLVFPVKRIDARLSAMETFKLLASFDRHTAALLYATNLWHRVRHGFENHQPES